MAIHLAEPVGFEPINLRDKIEARDFSQELIAETVAPEITPKPEVKHGDDKKAAKADDLEELSTTWT